MNWNITILGLITALLPLALINCRSVPTAEYVSPVSAANEIPNPEPTPTLEQEQYREALDSIWIETDQTKLNGITITRECRSESENDYLGVCELTISSKGKVLRTFAIEHGRKDWLKYGLFNFLGTTNKQLVVFSYSGGAHCCSDYAIFDFVPKFRVVYDSNIADSVNEVGNELVPIDIDGDGVFEFHRDVMAFDYMGAAGHAGTSFPPAIFAFDKKAAKYVPATKRFPGFVEKQLENVLSELDITPETDVEALNEYRVRTKFLYMVYAGQRDSGWKYFEENYRSATGNGYQEQFKEQFKKKFLEIFAKEPTYLSIYGQP